MSDSKSSKAPESQADSADTAEIAGEKHNKVLHTRIPPSLDREIKLRARGLGMSVSTVVRNVLLHTFDLVEDIVNDSANVALSIAGDEADEKGDTKSRALRSRRTHNASDSTIIAWQEAVLNLNAVCDRCNTILATGSKAAIAIRDQPGPTTIICTACVDALADDDGDSRSDS